MFRTLLYSSFAILFFMSLVCSVSIRHGHADVPVAETADAIRPLGAGDAAPRFTVETVDNEKFEFNPQNLKRPVVLLAFRGGWCPFCNMYLSDMRHVIPEISAMGIDVLFLSGDRPELLFTSLNREAQEDIAGLDYTILSDANAQAAIALGIAFRASDRTVNRRNEKGEDIVGSSMDRHGVLPVPAVFAIDSHGIIQFAYTNPNYKVRLPADDLLAAAREIAAAD
jgi:peroxiredoxin